MMILNISSLVYGGSTAKRGWGERNSLTLDHFRSPLRAACAAHLPRKRGRRKTES